MLCIISLIPLRAQTPAVPTELFPLRPGTYWIYKGVVRWYDGENDKPGSTDVTWKMSVLQVIRRPGVVGAVVSGFPADLDWTGGTTEPKPWLILETDKHQVFYENLGPDYDLSKLNGDDHVFDKFMADENLFLQWPVQQHAKFCDADAKRREDDMYCWVVAETAKRKLQSVSGVPSEEQPVYRMEYRTLPDDQKIEIVPGIGVVTYQYHHHGTLAETELTLAEFHPAEEKVEPQGTNR